ncbi:MAG: hypothetical protein WC304_03820, partial [Candidatus Gracilibacteria bacterium]
ENYLLANLHRILFIQILKSKYPELFNYLKANKVDCYPGSHFLASYYAFRFGGNQTSAAIKSSDDPRSLMVCRESNLVTSIMSKIGIYEDSGGRLKIEEFDKFVDIVDSASQKYTVDIGDNVKISG